MTSLTCFKPYDIRGQLGAELNEDIAYRIGRETSAHLGAPWSHEVALRMIGLNSVDGYRLLRGLRRRLPGRGPPGRVRPALRACHR